MSARIVSGYSEERKTIGNFKVRSLVDYFSFFYSIIGVIYLERREPVVAPVTAELRI